MASWAAEELRTVKLGDARLGKRLVGMVEALAARPSASVPQAMGEWAATKAAYNFWDSEHVEAEAIRGAHRESTVERMSGHRTVLVAQDTTDLRFVRRGQADERLGLKVHSGLGVSLEGVPLGVVHQQVWVRKPEEAGKAKQRRQLETKDKESQRWLDTLDATLEAIPASTEVITVADREADIYDLFAHKRRAGGELLVRATQDRKVSAVGDEVTQSAETTYLWQALEGLEPAGTLSVEVDRNGDTPGRTALLTVRYTQLEIQPPHHHKARAKLRPIPLGVVLAREEQPPADTKPIRWLLLTTLSVTSLAQALQCIHWYSYRWLIERYHFVLKSGCTLEELQLETQKRLERALATYSLVAWRLLWLTYEARRNPDAPCDQMLQPHEWQSLYCTIHRDATPPPEPPTLHQAVRWIAQLGGFLARKRDGEPGVKTIWRGLTRLNDIASTWLLLHPHTPTLPNHSALMGKG
jgi:hypothetical protein